MANFDGTDEYFDSRDAIERIAELTAEWEEGANYGESEPTITASDYSLSENDWEAYLGPDGAAELVALLALQEEADGVIADWKHGETFYTWEAFVDHCRGLAVDCGYLPSEVPGWIENNIDWDGVAEDLSDDYTEFEFRGTTYYAR